MKAKKYKNRKSELKLTKTKFPRGTKFDEAYPEIVNNHWDYDNNDFLPNEITYGASRKKVSLICENGHRFEISPSSLSKGHWCVKCRNERQADINIRKSLKSGNTFAEINPEKSKFWSDKNDRSPDEVSYGSTYEATFVCSKGHEFSSLVYNVSNGRWCPYCSGQRLTYSNSFGYLNPDKVKHWSEDNDKSPYNVTKSSDYMAKFICEIGHEFSAQCKDVNSGKWCAVCAKRPKIDNELVDERLRGRSIVRLGEYVNARTPLEFKCLECDDEFKSYPDAVMNKMTGCPACSSSKGELEVIRILSDMGLDFEIEFSFEGLIGLGGKPLRYDFCINLEDKIILVEYDGIFHYEEVFDGSGHETIKEHDKIKNQFCLDHDIKLIRIPYWEFNNIHNILFDNLR